MPRIVFRTDASSTIGSGHVMRCLTLAGLLRERGAEVDFLCRSLPGDLCALIEARGYPVRRLVIADSLRDSLDESLDDLLAADLQASSEAMHGRRADWLVVDHYRLDARWEQGMRAHAARILAIDDLADRPHDCELLLDQNIVANAGQRYRALLPPRAAGMTGPRYALLQPAYAALHAAARVRSGRPRRILVFFGAADQANLTGRTLEAILSLSCGDIGIDLVLPASGLHRASLLALAAGQPNIALHENLPTLAGLMAGADLAIGAGGTTSWERLCLGLPALVVTIAENQRAITQELDRLGLVRWLGDQQQATAARIATALEELLESGLDAAWSARCLQAVDGLGAQRVADVLLQSAQDSPAARRAGAQDEALLLEWANDPLTRRTAFSPDPISPATHHAWFARRLENSQGCRLYIMQTTGGEPLGQVRFERGEGEWEVHYALAPLFRGRGLGQSMLAAALQAFGAEFAGSTILGQVKPDNAPSCRIFESLEFSRKTLPDSGIVQFRRML